MVGALVERDSQITAHRTIRDDVLDCLFGKASAGPKTLIRTALDAFAENADGVRSLDWPFLGLTPGQLRHTYSASVADALRQAVLMYSSLGSPDKLDEDSETDAPNQEESNQRFSTELRAAVIAMHPEAGTWFGRSAVLIEGGEPVKFGLCSPRAILHFGVLSPVRQSSGLRDARARMWELYRAKEIANLPQAGLIMAAPRSDDPTLSSRQTNALRRNLQEIEREADSYNMRFFPVTSVPEGASRLIEFAL